MINKQPVEHMGDEMLGDEFWATNHEATSDETYRRSGNQAMKKVNAEKY